MDGLTPALNGIARKRRSDAGVPRRSTLDALYDMFADLTPDAQHGVLEILGAIHRQALRGKSKVTNPPNGE